MLGITAGGASGFRVAACFGGCARSLGMLGGFDRDGGGTLGVGRRPEACSVDALCVAGVGGRGTEGGGR